MGTNFYVRENECPTCHHGKDIHVGKQSFGWVFSFNGQEIKTVKLWKEYLKEMDGYIYDEYDEKITAEQLIKEIEETKTCRENPFSNYRYCKEYYKYRSGGGWEDEGFSFILNDFS